MRHVGTTTLRARFAARLSQLYGREVPAYATLVDTCHQVNRRVLDRDPTAAQRLGSIERVTAERHGAVRVGSPRELAQVARLFGALGMHPIGFYDLRDAEPQPVPVVSTAFRPIDSGELAANPFRVFTSMLVPEDRRFFSADLQSRLKRYIDARTLFSPQLLNLADRAEAEGGLPADDADRFLVMATDAFAISTSPIDRLWYEELAAVSSVAADIGGVPTTHINHLTPRVLDIDDLYESMGRRGINMIDRIQGPPRWDGPDLLLRQTSFRALAEARRFREPDGRLVDGTLRVRFGEVESRGIALTPDGRDTYDRALAEIDRRHRCDPRAPRTDVASAVWREQIPASEHELFEQDLAFFTYCVADTRPPGRTPGELSRLVDDGWLRLEPIVYEDFLPRSAAGIFASNLTGASRVDAEHGGARRSADWLAARIDRAINVPEQLYREQSDASLAAAVAILARAGVTPRHHD